MVVSTDNVPEEITIAEQRVTFCNLSWSAYEQLLVALGERRSSRITYNQGTLEITMPSEEHEYAVRLIELFIRILVEELNLEIKTMGSTTLKRPDLQKGAEPDNCYYIQNQPLVAGKIVNLNQDPPPDLIVEVDITSTNINKLDLYASMGVPEFWRYNGEVLRIYQLQEHQYIELENSPTFSRTVKEQLYQFLQTSQVDEVTAENSLRSLIQQEIQGKSTSL
jgi:Uma2 family endonuclease